MLPCYFSNTFVSGNLPLTAGTARVQVGCVLRHQKTPLGALRPCTTQQSHANTALCAWYTATLLPCETLECQRDRSCASTLVTPYKTCARHAHSRLRHQNDPKQLLAFLRRSLIVSSAWSSVSLKALTALSASISFCLSPETTVRSRRFSESVVCQEPKNVRC